jgi:ABC-type amino acid transport substrate-binding protein
LVPEYRETAFEAIIPSVRAGDFNVGMSSFTDTAGRFADRQASHQWGGEVAARQL